MNHIQHIRRLTTALAGLAGALLAFAAAAPAALARADPPLPLCWPLTDPPPGHWTGPVYQVPVRTVVVGGMPGWQIALIAAAAALAVATAAVLLDRARRAPHDDHRGRLSDTRAPAAPG